MNHDSDSERMSERLWHGGPQLCGSTNIIRYLLWFTPQMNLHDFPTEHIITAAPVLTMSDTCFFVVILKLFNFHDSESVVPCAAECLFESCGYGRVSRGEWRKV